MDDFVQAEYQRLWIMHVDVCVCVWGGGITSFADYQGTIIIILLWSNWIEGKEGEKKPKTKKLVYIDVRCLFTAFYPCPLSN